MFSLNEPNCIIIYLFSLLLQTVGGLRPKFSRTDRLYRIFDYFAVSSSSKSGGSSESIFYGSASSWRTTYNVIVINKYIQK